MRTSNLLCLFLLTACDTGGGDLADSLAANSGSGPSWSSSPDVVSLSRELFVLTQAELAQDHDSDFQVDSIEAELAAKVVPWVFFSQYEDALQSFEPVTLFQVIPADCTGLGCPLAVTKLGTSSKFRYRVRVRFGFIWAYDSGYMGTEGEGFCGLDSHDGDTQGVTVELVSMNGRDWFIERYSINNTYNWPAHTATFRSGTHPVLYFSAGKHHHFLDTALDDENSPYSDFGCNDRIDESGSAFHPNLTSPYSDGRKNNVGEVANHSSTYFVHDLGPYGYSGYSAWGTADFMDADPVRDLWFEEVPAPFSGNFLPPPFGTINVHVSGVDESQVTVYYTKANNTPQPWGRIPIDSAGNFSITLPASNAGTTYVVRPVASDYDFYPEYGFDEVPRAVTLAPGATVDISFDAHALPAPPSSGFASSGRAPAVLSVENAAKAALAKDLAMTIDAPEVLNALADPDVTWGTYFFTGLRYQESITVKVYTLLGPSGPAASWDEVSCYNLSLPKSGSHSICAMGAPVAGATIEFELLGGAKRIEPGADAVKTVTTNADGVAKITLLAGTHAGTLRVRARVVANPANPFFEPSRSVDVRIHPDAENEDGNPYRFAAPKLKSLQVVMLPGGGR